MSRIGRNPIEIPAGVSVTQEADIITVTGPKGTLQERLLPGLELVQADNTVTIKKTLENTTTQSSFGLMRTLVANMVTGVAQGYEKQLEVNGVGYRAATSGNTITLSLGFSHPVVYDLPADISAKVEKNVITISGHNKQLVGQVAANLRAFKKPEPYKGKGIKYIDERVRRKAGKTATKG